MNGYDIIGLSGALIAGVAYVPQIKHLVTQQCSAGISRPAYALWFSSSILITISATYIGSVVFIVLGAVQILSTALIYLYSTKYKGQMCPSHKQKYTDN